MTQNSVYARSNGETTNYNNKIFFKTLFNITTTEAAWKDHSPLEGSVHKYNGWQSVPKKQEPLEKIKMQQELNSFFASVFTVETERVQVPSSYTKAWHPMTGKLSVS